MIWQFKSPQLLAVRTVKTQFDHQSGFDQAPAAAPVPNQQSLPIRRYRDNILMRHRDGTIAWHDDAKRNERSRLQCLFNGLNPHAINSRH